MVSDAEESGESAAGSDLMDISEENEPAIPETYEDQEPGQGNGDDDMASEGILKAGQAESGSWSLLRTALQQSGSIILNRDYTAAEGDLALVIPEERSVILNLNGHTISSGTTQNLLEVYGTLLLHGPGTLSLQNGDHIVYVRDGGSVDMQGAEITSENCRDTVFLFTTKDRARLHNGDCR